MEEVKEVVYRPPATDLIVITKDYIENMINMSEARKALILDEDTLGILYGLFRKLKMVKYGC